MSRSSRDWRRHHATSLQSRSRDLRLDPDLDRGRVKEEERAELLKKAMTIEPENADVRYALGLALVRKHDYAGALDLLRRPTSS